MLVLSRRLNESLVIGDDTIVKVIGVGTGRVRLGIESKSGTRVMRQEAIDKPRRNHYNEDEVVVKEEPLIVEAQKQRGDVTA